MEKNNNLDILAKILAFDQICSQEEWETRKNELEAIIGSKLS